MARPRLKDDRGALERALNGMHEPLPVDLSVSLRGREGVFRAIRETMRVILYNRHRKGAFGAKTAYDTRAVANDVARAAHWYVRRQIDYWGIDPHKEGYCTKCRQKKPLREFPTLSRCQSCVSSRT